MITDKINLDNNGCNLESEVIHNDINDYNSSIMNNFQGISIMLVNICSLNKNFDNLLIYLNSMNPKPDILVCSETRNLVCPNYFNIHGYVIHYNNSTINICDGVVVYVKSNLRHNASTESIGQAKFLNIIIELDNNIELKISSIYRCFGHDKSNFINSIKQLLIKNVNVQNHIIIGDFNIDLKT